MDLDTIAADTSHRHLAARAQWRPDPPDSSHERCPGCGAPLSLDLVGPDDPDRFVGACQAPQCGEVVAYRIFERRLIVAERRRR
jgi:hypothetical protein